ncbi:cyclic nucleotide-binding domain-containing protein [Spirochaeta isovalerica]|uniref:Anti-sigma regulatory factor (Ser/Thr protein kinase) n=1 Tax=Spirochaeta isovalerica TaxID=150 RepID=A0A841R5U2_9SPIO|nr:cyclic nucleotide-binding domain-containing protein [Spirochaeta isovalerica]MBB6479206.1 anti-sigma regulatory factor (Ser/Thr protein kinase) [Spirochaeta isovalerica]
MGNIAILSSNQRINFLIEEHCRTWMDDFKCNFFDDCNKFVQFLNYELPSINIICIDDPDTESSKALRSIRKDPWLHFGGTIILYNTSDEREIIQNLKGINIVTLISFSKLEFNLPRVFRIIGNNRWVLFQREIHSLLSSSISGHFVLNNDPFDLITYSNLIANFLYNSGLVDAEGKEGFYIAIMELFMNAIEHGNCSISFEEKSRYLEKEGNIFDLINQKNQDPEIGNRKVVVHYRITPDGSSFTIRDEGKGFDWRNYRSTTGEAGLDEQHGRGILMAMHYLKDLKFNDKGNEVTFHVEHLEHKSNEYPTFFSGRDEVSFKEGEVVFTQGDESNYLYYIVSGKYEIIANGIAVSTLTPADLFLGEMSFLLNNKRSATVKAVKSGELLKITKEEFINAMKKKPYYGILLSRILATRLVSLHESKRRT